MSDILNVLIREQLVYLLVHIAEGIFFLFFVAFHEKNLAELPKSGHGAKKKHLRMKKTLKELSNRCFPVLRSTQFEHFMRIGQAVLEEVNFKHGDYINDYYFLTKYKYTQFAFSNIISYYRFNERRFLIFSFIKAPSS